MRTRLSCPRRTLVVAIAIVCGTPAQAITLTVNDAGDDAAAAGCTLRDAITAINAAAFKASDPCRTGSSGAFFSNDTIVFDAALANSTITLARGELKSTRSMTITGSGQTIDAHSGAYSAFDARAGLTMSNITLTGGNASSGGGLLSQQNTLTRVALDHVVVTGNHASSGGGIYALKTTLSITNSNVSSNISDNLTAGIRCQTGSLTMRDTVVSTNSTVAHVVVPGINAGGLYLGGCNATIYDSTVSDNTTICGGSYCVGGVSIQGSTVNIVRSTISGNKAVGSATAQHLFGGLYTVTALTSIQDSTIVDNIATGYNFLAGAIGEIEAASTATHFLTLTNSTVTGNHANAIGAAIASVSGGIAVGFQIGGSTMIYNSIVTNNEVNNSASGGSLSDIFLMTTTVPTPTVVASNDLFGSELSDAFPGSGNVFSDDPLLGPLQNNGGLTLTRAPLSGSPAIDAGSNKLAVDASGHLLVRDQTSSPRFFGTVDIGAVENQGDRIFADGFD